MDEFTRCVHWLRQKTKEAGAKGLIVGLSGGVDSAVVGALIAQAFPEHSLGLVMPCYSPPQDREDAILGAEAVNLRWEELDLAQAHASLWEGANGLVRTDVTQNPEANGNLRARLRMCTLYTVAALKNYLVVGTDNWAEYFVGYFTKYGDGGVDLLPIGALTKSQVYRWAEYAKIPEAILKKAPSAGLWPGQTDEAELGLSYEEIDSYLEGKNIADEKRARIEYLNKVTEHKRVPPPIFQP